MDNTFCRSCGLAIPDDSRFCPRCGKEIITAEDGASDHTGALNFEENALGSSISKDNTATNCKADNREEKTAAEAELQSFIALGQKLLANPENTPIEKYLNKIKEVSALFKMSPLPKETVSDLRAALYLEAYNLAVVLYKEKKLANFAHLITDTLCKEYIDIPGVSSKARTMAQFYGAEFLKELKELDKKSNWVVWAVFGGIVIVVFIILSII